MMDTRVRDTKISCIDLIVTKVEHFSPRLFLLELSPQDDMSLPVCEPGQFVELHVKGCDGVFLRRPISIYYSSESVVGLLIQVAGRGTEHLSKARVGDTINAILPLGNTFSAPQGKRPLLVGGGVGLAPMLSLGQKLKSQGFEPIYLLGGRSIDAFPDLSMFEGSGVLHLTTEDASRGEKGFVTNHSILKQEFSDVYVCGPTPMMKSVAKWAKSRAIRCEVSLENIMACGMGVCLCCVEPTTKGHKCVCTDGPVFNTQDLLW
ncbi:dihydroorotate dehydrogenase electron transfer subunit [Porphyromonas sp.]|uniref:dihydroorotate dehydrogenase electron transfer subunit n=1 Tax=Porphyromonas sp. TaxID=1924944 RepID=UPI0034C618B2